MLLNSVTLEVDLHKARPTFMEFNELENIRNASLVVNHFGYWPDFHDSEVISIQYKRDYNIGRLPSIELQLYSFEMTNKVAGRHYKLVKHCFVSFELLDVSENSMDGFNHQNALSSIEISRADEYTVCELNASYGVDARFVCKEMIVKSLMPIAK